MIRRWSKPAGNAKKPPWLQDSLRIDGILTRIRQQLDLGCSTMDPVESGDAADWKGVGFGMSSCAFTGHRPKRFERDGHALFAHSLIIKKTLAAMVRGFYAKGVEEYFVGGSLGVDMWAAEAVLGLKQQKGYQGLRLISVIPFRDQAKQWGRLERVRYEAILEQSHQVICLQEQYSKGVFLMRNRYLVDHAEYLIAVYDEGEYRNSGTGQTVSYAQKQGKHITILHPETFQQTTVMPKGALQYQQMPLLEHLV